MLATKCVLVVILPLPPHLPIKSSFFVLFDKKTLKEKCDEERQESKIYPLKLSKIHVWTLLERKL